MPQSGFTALPRYGSVCDMSSQKFPASPRHILPPDVRITMADGTCLTAAVRLSARARSARMALTPRGNLVLTVPQSMGAAQLEASLPLFLPWLERVCQAASRPAPRPELPQSITLPLPDQEYAVLLGGDMAAGRRAATGAASRPVVLDHKAQRLLLVEEPGRLRLFGSVENAELCASAMRQWCRQTANRLLPPFLEHLAATGGFALAHICVRDQRARWGSCSRQRPGRGAKQEAPTRQAPGRRTPIEMLTARVRDFFVPQGQATQSQPAQPPAGRINLNWRALLLPVPLLEHLCWHELCHLRHMNHSPAYREELARYSPQWAACEKALNTAWRALPWWALPDDGAPSSRP